MMQFDQRLHMAFSAASSSLHHHFPLLPPPLSAKPPSLPPPLPQPWHRVGLPTSTRNKKNSDLLVIAQAIGASGVDADAGDENANHIGPLGSDKIKAKVIDVASDEAVEGPSSRVVHETAREALESITNPIELVEVAADALVDESVAHVASLGSDSSDGDLDKREVMPFVDVGSGPEEGSEAVDSMTPSPTGEN